MSNFMQNNNENNPCFLEQKIDKTRYLVEIHFSEKSTRKVEDKLKHVILHDLEYGKQGKVMKKSLTSCNRGCYCV